MTRYAINLSAALLLFTAMSVFGQEFSVTVSYLHGEKSKDSHSSHENISISGNTASYSIKYSGRRGKNQEDMDKVCELTEQDIKNIRVTIAAKELDKSDSLFQESSKTKSYEVYTNISIMISMDGQAYNIKLNGDVNELNDSKLYKNSVFFITLLRKMIEDCR